MKTSIANKSGVALITVLVISFILFSMLSIAVTAGYNLHKENRLMMKQLQQRLDKGHVPANKG